MEETCDLGPFVSCLFIMEISLGQILLKKLPEVTNFAKRLASLGSRLASSPLAIWWNKLRLWGGDEGVQNNDDQQVLL